MYVRQAYLLKYVCRQFYIQVKVWWRCRRKKHRVTGTRTRSGSSVAKESCINLDLLVWRNQTRKVYVALWTTQQQQVGRTHQLWLTYTTTTATLSLLSPPAHFIFMFSGMTDQAMVVVWPMKKDDNCSFPVLSQLQLPCPRAGYIDFGCLQPTLSFEPDYSITASTKAWWPNVWTSAGQTTVLLVIIVKCNIISFKLKHTPPEFYVPSVYLLFS